MSEDDRITYIKESLDTLHQKVDLIYRDADARLKSLEESRAHGKGFSNAVAIMAGIVGGLVTTVVTYLGSGDRH